MKYHIITVNTKTNEIIAEETRDNFLLACSYCMMHENEEQNVKCFMKEID